MKDAEKLDRVIFTADTIANDVRKARYDESSNPAYFHGPSFGSIHYCIDRLLGLVEKFSA